jgi:hypothetical protein
VPHLPSFSDCLNQVYYNIKTVNGRLIIYDCNHVILLIMLMVKYKFITEMILILWEKKLYNDIMDTSNDCHCLWGKHIIQSYVLWMWNKNHIL